MVAHNDSQPLYLESGIGSAVTGAISNTKTEWPPCESTLQTHLAEIWSDSGVVVGGDSVITFN